MSRNERRDRSERCEPTEREGQRNTGEREGTSEQRDTASGNDRSERGGRRNAASGDDIGDQPDGSRRRAYLRTVAAGVLAGAAGCGGSRFGSPSSERTGSPGTEPPSTEETVTAEEPPTRLVLDDVAAGGRFGQSVAVSGDTVLAVAPGDTESGAGDGSAHAVRLTDGEWTRRRLQTGAGGAPRSAAIDGDRAVVAGWDPNTAGSVTFYHRNRDEWRRRARKTGERERSFDNEVALAGDTAVVGGVGEATVFRRTSDGWTHESRLAVADDDRFGRSVAVDPPTVVVGGSDAYVFSRNDGSWRRTVTLARDDRPATFGRAVAFSGRTAVVGAPEERGGCLTLFARRGGEWTERVTFAAGSAGLATALAAVGDVIVAGAPGDDVIRENAGTVHLYDRTADSWDPRREIHPDGLGRNDAFGSSVATDGDRVAVGAPTRNDDEVDDGVVFVYD